MPSVYMTKEMFQKLDNKELITKQMDINAKIERAAVKGFPQNIYNDMIQIRTWIEEEIDARLDDGRMDEDELDEDF
jgi:hypothetical protein